MTKILSQTLLKFVNLHYLPEFSSDSTSQAAILRIFLRIGVLVHSDNRSIVKYKRKPTAYCLVLFA